MNENDFEGDKPRRGRPASGQGVKIGGRIPADLDARIDAFAAENFMTRAEAIRALLERGLKDDEPGRR